jgi:Flp pilus assembly protein TadG
MSRRQTGAALVEFALILPFMLVITLGIIAIGRYAYFGMVVANAARAGASYGAQRNGGASEDTAGITAAAQADASGNGVGTITTVTVPPSNCMIWVSTTPQPSPNPTADPGCATPLPTDHTQHILTYVTVTVTGTANAGFNVPFIPQMVTQTATATMRVGQSQ